MKNLILFYNFFFNFIKMIQIYIKTYFFKNFLNIKLAYSQVLYFINLKIILNFFKSDYTKILIVFLFCGFFLGNFFFYNYYFNNYGVQFNKHFLVLFLSIGFGFLIELFRVLRNSSFYCFFKFGCKEIVLNKKKIFMIKYNLKLFFDKFSQSIIDRFENLFEFSFSKINLKRKLFVTGIVISSVFLISLMFWFFCFGFSEFFFFSKAYLLIKNNLYFLFSCLTYYIFIQESFLFSLMAFFFLLFSFLHIFYAIQNIIFDYLSNKLLSNLFYLMYFIIFCMSIILFWFFFTDH